MKNDDVIDRTANGRKLVDEATAPDSIDYDPELAAAEAFDEVNRDGMLGAKDRAAFVRSFTERVERPNVGRKMGRLSKAEFQMIAKSVIHERRERLFLERARAEEHLTEAMRTIVVASLKQRFILREGETNFASDLHDGTLYAERNEPKKKFDALDLLKKILEDDR